MHLQINRHILIVDDSKEIHDLFKIILTKTIINSKVTPDIFKKESPFAKKSIKSIISPQVNYLLDHAYQKNEAFNLIDSATSRYGSIYDLIFIDIKMLSKPDGFNIILKIWDNYPSLNIVLLSEDSNYSWETLVQIFGYKDNLFFINKPLNHTTIKQLSFALTTKVKLEKNKNNYHNKIIKDKDNAEQANKAKTVFLSNMSHEIRTPLAGIISFAEILLSNNNFKNNKYISLIKDEAHKLRLLLNQILDLSKIEAEKMELDNSEFNFKKMILTIQESFKILTKNKGLLFYLNLDQNIPEYLIGDSLRLNQVLLNLLHNAVKFTDEGSIKLTVKQKTINNEKITISFEISDTGIGIPRDKHSIIFKPFIQANQNVFKKHGGTGLGLPIARKLVKLMGGELILIDKETKGAVFYFEVIFTLKYSIRHSDKTSKISKRYNLKNIKILLIEDYPSNQEIVIAHLKKYACNIIISENGELGVNQVKKNHFDLIFMDCQMPVMDGYEATRRIREFNKNIPIVAFTANSFDEDIRKCLSVGMNDVMSKPILRNNIIDMVRKWC